MNRVCNAPAPIFVGAMIILLTANGLGSASNHPWHFTKGTAAARWTVSSVFLEEEKVADSAKLNLDSQGVILKGYDVVAYFKERKPVKGNPTITSTYRGAAYQFASAANKAEFDKDPQKYAPKYGAFCAYGVSVGVLADPEGPGAFLVYKGKLYICGNQGALKDFKDDIDANIEKAEKNWRQLAAQ
jgi:YHS domain-containing protein